MSNDRTRRAPLSLCRSRKNVLDMIFAFLLCCLTWRESASHCYSNICRNKTTDLEDSGPRCLVTSVQRGKDCLNLRFDNPNVPPTSDESLGIFRLSAYVKDFGEFRGRTTAFNLSISDIKFHRLLTRYQESSNERNAACREINILGNDASVPFPEIFVSCPFAEERFEATSYRLEYLAIGKGFEYGRKFVFVVPKHYRIDKDRNDVKSFAPFFYVDVSNAENLSLRLQPVPEQFNVTRYKVWLVNNDTNHAIGLELKRDDRQQEIRQNFSVAEGVHYFRVAALHPSCGNDGCVNATSPAIVTKQPNHRLLIMIISVVWIPPVILYAMYYIYKLYMKNSLVKREHRRTNCLLVYSPTHAAHIDVMRKFAAYMRKCNINAMIDALDIPDTPNMDPGLWCNSAFRDADVIVVATSPPPSDVAAVPVIYRDMDNHALRLLKENYSKRNKRYVVVQFPYCGRDDLPEEARLFRRFGMPQELEKLVRNICVSGRLHFFGISSDEFTEAVKFATSEISRDKLIRRGPISIESDSSVTAPLARVSLSSPTFHNMGKIENEKMEETSDANESHRYFATKIEELNLLGEDSGESEVNAYVPSDENDEFRIDRLDL